MGCNIANVGASERVPETGATSRPSLAIDSCDEYAIRGEQTSQVRSSSRHTFNANRTYTFTFSPTAVLAARRKIVCPTCTVNPEQPVMIEEQTEWVIHQKTRRISFGVVRGHISIGKIDIGTVQIFGPMEGGRLVG